MSVEEMAHRAVELLEKGLSIHEITQKMQLSEATVEWLLNSKYANDSSVARKYVLEGKKEDELERAKHHEKLLEYEEAAEIYKKYGMDDDVIRVRKEARNKVSQTVVHGDYVDDRDTIVTDSVVSKSNVGAGGKSKAEKLREVKALLDDGIIDDDEFKQMKKEILGK